MIHVRSILAMALLAYLPNALAQFFPDDGAKRQHKPGRTCVATADSERVHSVRCTESTEPTNPRDIAMQKCHDQARPHRGTPQWAEHMKECIQRVMEDHPMQSKRD